MTDTIPTARPAFNIGETNPDSALDIQQPTPPAVDHDADPEGFVAYDGFEKIYTCLPLKNWQLGPFSFVDGQLSIRDEASVEEFESLINHPKFPTSDRVKIKTLNLELAEKIAKDSIPAATKGMDQGLNPGLQALKSEVPKVGTDNIGTKANVGNT